VEFIICFKAPDNSGLLKNVLKRNYQIMGDNAKARNPQDSSRININQDYEVRYWTKALGVSEDELRNAVNSVGVSAEKVREFLRGRNR
jgi:hypothetical protein